jgi:FkbM family methyltransferase
MEIYNEKGEKVDTKTFETREQVHASLFIEPNDVVLELGARFGSVSVVINQKLNNKLNHLAVDPDDRIWECLEKNRDLNQCQFHILKGVISRYPVKLENLDECFGGYGTTSVHTNEPTKVKSYTLEEVENVYGLKFTTLVADCEGFLETFFDENPKLYDQLNTVLYEIDYPEKCNYDKIAQNLKNHGLTNLWYGSHLVWKRL